MKLNTYGQKLRPDLERIILIHWGHFLCLIIAMVMEAWLKVNGPWSLLWLVALFITYRLFFKTVKNLLYSFWTFSGGVMIYILYALMMNIFVYENDILLYTYLTDLTFLLFEMYMLYSPIHFPKVIWWEYDFRYRHDLKIDIRRQESTLEGRLTDLRRGAGCVVLFQDIEIGELLAIKATTENKDAALNAEIMSKKEYTFGRGFAYGVKFHFTSADDKNSFKELCRWYRRERSSKRKLKKFQLNNS